MTQTPFDSLFPEPGATLDEQALVNLFTKRVEEMMRDDLGLLLSTLYRLDIYEEKIQAALRSATVPPAEGIARLIIERQKEKIETRKKYSSGESGKGIE